MSDSSLINIGELSKPATVLIEKISDAVGGVFRPHQIIRVAHAEAEAERIKAESAITISDLQRRAFNRFIEEEGHKQENMEAITQKALPQLQDSSKPDQLENDWISNFFDKCRLISDGEMQDLWSRVLAGEANNPNTYSKRTVNFLSSLDKSDAELFTKFCTYVWLIGGLTPLIFDEHHAIYEKNGINFNSLSHLESIGLIQFNNIAGFQRLKLPKSFPAFYYGLPTLLEMPNESDNNLPIGKALLTKTGRELAPISGCKSDDEFKKYICDKWRAEGYIKANETEQDAAANP